MRVFTLFQYRSIGKKMSLKPRESGVFGELSYDVDCSAFYAQTL